jgi:hypothetical protein
MSYYYKYKFISPEPLYAKVKEELRSYFETGVVDDLLFPIWTKHCLDNLGKSSYVITETYFEVEDYKAKLPSDFHSVREAWMCATTYQKYPLPGAVYTSTAMRITPEGLQCPSNECPGRCDMCSDLMYVTYKITDEVITGFSKKFLLKPGNISNSGCDFFCANYGSTSLDTFDIVGDKFVTNFRKGSVYMVYYADPTSECGAPLIPDNIKIRQYIEDYIKYKIFEQVYNSVTDETFNQVQNKYMNYRQIAEESFVVASIETKKETTQQKMMKIKNSYNRFNRYNID